MYYIVFGLLCFFSLFYELIPVHRNNNKRSSFKIIYSIFFIILFSISAFRWNVGGDSFIYKEAFDLYVPTITNVLDFYKFNSKWEPLFVGLMSICKTLVNDFLFFQIVHSFIVNFVLFGFFKRYSPFPILSVTIYSYMCYFYFNTEILRESLAVICFIFMYSSFKQEKYKKYYLLNIVALGFHLSAFILFFLPLLKKIKFSYRRIIYIFIGAFILMSSMYYILGAFSSFSFIIKRLEIFSQMSFNYTGMIVTFLMFIVLPFFIIRYLKRRNVNYFDELIVFYFMIASVFVFINGLGRLMNYLLPFMIVYFSVFVYYLRRDSKLILIRGAIILLCLMLTGYYKFLYYSKDTSHVVKGTTKWNIYYPYSSVFNKEKYIWRSRLYYEVMEEDFNKATQDIK